MTSLRQALDAPRTPAIDGLRAVAILMLVGGHYATAESMAAWLDPFSRAANLSITLLFVVTGFIVTHRLLVEDRSTRDIDVASWVSRKLLRLYPTLIAALLASAAIQSLNEGPSVPFGRFFGYLALLGNYYYAIAQEDQFRHNVGHLWSIFVGVHFLIPWAYTLRLATQRRKTAELVRPLAALIAASLALRVGLSFTAVPESHTYLATETRVAEIGVGALTALLAHLHADNLRLDRLLGRSWFQAMAYVGGLLSMASDHLVLLSLRPFAFALSMIILVRGGGVLTPLLDLRPMVWISMISYSVFTWHRYALDMDPFIAGLAWPVRVPLILIATFTLSAVMYAILERPIRARINQERTWRPSLRRRRTRDH